MSENSAIEWTDHTWSPWEGCQKVGAGCDHCYAEARNQRFAAGANWGPGAPRRRTADASWLKPVKWNDSAAARGVRERVFPSICDPFDNQVHEAWRGDFLWLVEHTPHLDWLCLTKRIGNATPMLANLGYADRMPANLWIGATVVNQEEADRDIPKLLATPARVRFLSIEPMLGPIDLSDIALRRGTGDEEHLDALTFDGDADDEPELGTETLDWVIAGGESGPHARPAHPDWFRSLRDQCAAAGVPFLFKQHGEWIGVPDLRRLEGGQGPGFGRFDSCSFDEEHEAVRVGKKAAGRLLDGVQHDEVPTP